MEFTTGNKKDFNSDIKILFENLKKGEKFSFSKYADGEYAILINKYIKNCDNWVFNPDIHKKEQEMLLESFTFSDDGYFVGISCPCCVPQEHVDWMRKTVSVKDTNLTWANIFVNGNFNYFKDNFISEFKNHDIILFANKNANINNLPFAIEEFIPIGDTAWVENFDLIDSFDIEKYNNKLFLFCAGPLGNMLSYKFWQKNKNNCYMDIGSTLNSFLVGNNRGYLRGAATLNKVCKW